MPSSKTATLTLTLLTLGFLPPLAAAQQTPGPRRAEPVDHPALQRALASSHAGYQAFLRDAGGAWLARFDETTGSPVSIVGSGLALAGGPPGTIDRAAVEARLVLERFPDLWGAPIGDFALVGSVRTGPLFVFTWQQRFDGLEVRGARVQIQVHEAGRVASLLATGVAIPEGFSRVPSFGPDRAEALFAAGKTLEPGDTVEAADFLVFAKPEGLRAVPRLAYRVDVEQPSVENFERVFVDALDGSILEVEPGRYHLGEVRGRVTGSVNLSLSGLAASTPGQPLAGVTVTVAGVGSAVTDSNGDYSLQTALAGPFNVSAELKGPLYDVSTAQGTNLSAAATTAFSGGADVADLVFNAPPDQYGTAQATAAYHTEKVLRYMQQYLPRFPGYASQKVSVNQASSCNASFNPSTNQMNFYHAAGGCVNSCYSTVLYHEYGHGVDDWYGGVSSGPLSEALGDIVAMFATSQPIVGADFKGSGTNIRTGENNTSWPASSCSGQVHCVGQTFMGFAWQARKKLVSSQGTTAGHALAEALFHGTFPVDNTSILNAVTQVFLLDDDDGDLTNGTPHFDDLSSAAILKGFTPPKVLVIDVQHLGHPDTWSQTQPYPIRATLVPLTATTITGAWVDWRTDGSSSIASTPMAPLPQQDEWVAYLPAQVGPELVHYWIRAVNSAGAEVTVPSGDDAFRFAIGRKTVLFLDYLEAGVPGWNHVQVSNQDDWQLGDPQTLGTNAYDPLVPFSGVNCWGNDLQTLGTNWDGLYKASVENYLETPPILTGGKSGVRVRFRRWLTVEAGQYDQATVRANGANIWFNPQSADQLDDTWTLQDHRAFGADGVTSFRVQWRLKSDGGVQFGGWNVDDVEVYALEATPVLSLSLLTNSSTPQLGTNLDFQLFGTSSAFWEIHAALGPGPTALPGYGVIEIDAASLAYFHSGQLSAAGSDGFSLPLPVIPALSGIEIWWIGAVLTNAGSLPQVSNVVKTTFQ